MRKIITLLICGAFLLVMPASLVKAQVQKPTKVTKAAYFDVTKPLRDIIPIEPGIRDRSWKDSLVGNVLDVSEYLNLRSDYAGPDPVIQTNQSRTRSEDPEILQNFEGRRNMSGIAPPDTDGDVGPNHYFQMVNLQFEIFDKEGNSLYGPADNSTIWDGFIGEWTGTNDGDPIVLYDEHADRWIVSQFALPNFFGPHYEMVAISKTNDPLGEYYRYAFEFETMPDYPKFGIWPDGYYFTINQFRPYAGAGVCVIDRDAMLAGDPDARLIFWDLANIYFGLLPADNDGDLPPAGSPQYFLSLHGQASHLFMWEARVNWSNPPLSVLEKLDDIPVAAFQNYDMVIKQPGTSQQLDPLTDRLMFRLQYRNFGDYEVLVTNHSVLAHGDKTGVRWYEIRSENGGPWEVYQQGTFAPDDGENRWMGSIAMNGAGDIGIGYSVSSRETYPSIRIAGQTAGAPLGLGVLDIPETTIKEGNASQTGVERWGDYSRMAIDPVDDNTFWYTTEYSNGGWKWRTRIASFSFGEAVPPPLISNFIANETNIFESQEINFEDLTTGNPTSWNWTFEGGDPSSSTEQHPADISYNEPGTYDVTLIVSNDLEDDTITKEDYISVQEIPLVADFEASETLLPEGGSIDFEDQSTGFPETWSWTFEGGEPGTSTEQHPKNIMYNEAGVFDVKLLVTRENTKDSTRAIDYVKVYPDILPEVGFYASETHICYDAEVSFTDTTKYLPNDWLWEFEPQTVTFVNGTDETSQNPEVKFDEADYYTVTLTAWNINGGSSTTKENYIIVGGIIPYYMETFESSSIGATYWTRKSHTTEVMWELYQTSGTEPGNMSAGIDFGAYYSQGEKDALISPPFNLTGNSDMHLRFSHAYAQRFADMTDSLYVYVSKDCSEDWVKIYAAGEDGSGNFATAEQTDDFMPEVPSDWCGTGWGANCVTLDLSDWKGESGVRIAFASISNFGNPLFIDNVEIGQYVEQQEIIQKNEDVMIYPNPARSVLHIDAGRELQRITILNQLGQTVFIDQPNTNKLTVDVSGFSRGVYFVRVETYKGINSHKVIIDNP